MNQILLEVCNLFGEMRNDRPRGRPLRSPAPTKDEAPAGGGGGGGLAVKPSNHHLRRKSTPAISLTGLKWPAHEDNGGGGGDDEDDEDEQGGKRKGASSSSRRRTDLLMAQASPRHEGCGFDSAQPPSIRTDRRTNPLEIPQILIRKWMDDTNCHSSPSASSETPLFSNAADPSDQLVAFEKAFLLNGAERCAWPPAAAAPPFRMP